MRFKALLYASMFLALLGGIAPSAWAAVDYTITVDVSSQMGNMGYIEFQLNPSSSATQAASAAVVNFSTDSTLIPPGVNSGDSMGQLPGQVSMDNGTSFNDYFEGITFGTTIHFDLLLDGPAIYSPDGTGGGTFTLDFLNSDQSGYLFTNDPVNDVPAFTVDINGDGSTTAMSYPSAGDGPPVVTFSGPSEIPEPRTIGLICAALGMLGVRRLRRRA